MCTHRCRATRSPSMFRRVIDGLCCVVRGKPRQRDFWRQRPLLAELLEDRTNPSVIAVGDEFIAQSDVYNASAEVAMDGAGNFVVVTESDDDPSSPDGWNGIFAARFNANGEPLGERFQVNTFVPGGQMDPAVAMNPDGNFVVVWESRDQDGDGAGIYGQRYNADGTPQGNEFRVNTYTTNWQSRPSVAMDADGNFVVVWDSSGQDGSAHGVFGQRYDADGAAQDAEFQVNTFTSYEQRYPAVAMNAAGDFVVAWESNGQEGSFGIYAQRYNATGMPQGDELHVNTFTMGGQLYPEVAMAGSGSFVVTWESVDQDGDRSGIFAQQFNAAGAKQGEELRINSDPDGDQHNPDVTMGDDSSFVVVWNEARDYFGQAYYPDGSRNGGTFRVNNTLSDVSQPAIAMNAQGSIVVTWYSVTDWATLARRFTLSAEQIIEPDRLEPNDVLASAHDLGLITGKIKESILTIDDADDVDWFHYSTLGTTTAEHFVRVDFDESQGELTATLFDEGGAVIRSSTSLGNRAEISLNDLPGGSYYVKVSGVGTTTNPGYNLIVFAEAPPSATPSVPDAGVSNGYSHAVAMDSAGDFVVAWQEYNMDVYDYDICAQRYDAAGVPRGSPFQVNTFTAGDQEYPVIAMDVDGDFVVVWTSEEQDGDSYGIYAQRYNALGARLGSEFRVNSVTAGNQYAPAVAMNEDGDFVIIWTDSARGGIYGQRYNPAGVPQSGEFQSSGTNGGYWGTVAMRNDGGFVVVWGSSGIEGQRYDALGAALGEPFEVTTANSANPSIAMDADGDFVVGWTEWDRDGDESGVFARQYDAEASPLGADFQVNSYCIGDQEGTCSAVAMADDGRFVITWESEYQDGYGTGIYARRYGADGIAQGGEFRVNTCSRGDQKWPAVAADARGNFVVVWSGPHADVAIHVRGFLDNSLVAADAYEPNESQATATDLGQVEGSFLLDGLSIHDPADEDWFAFSTVATAVTGHFVRIEYFDTLGDLDLELYDALGTLIKGSNTTGSHEEISLAGLASGTYLVRVLGKAGATNPYYSLRINSPLEIATDWAEPNDDRLAAYDLGAVTTERSVFDLSIHATGNDDWFCFQTEGNGPEDYVAIEFLSSAGDLDLELYDSSGTLLDTGPSTTDIEQITLAGLTNGTYYVRVLGYNGATNPHYNLTICSTGSALDPDWLEYPEPGNYSFAYAVDLRQFVATANVPNLTIHSTSDVDFFEFTMTEAPSADNSIALHFAHAQGNLDLELYDASYTLIASATSTTDNELLPLDGLPVGRYYLKAFGVAGATNRYELSFDLPWAQLDDWTVMVYMTSSNLAARAKNRSQRAGTGRANVARNREPGGLLGSEHRLCLPDGEWQPAGLGRGRPGFRGSRQGPVRDRYAIRIARREGQRGACRPGRVRRLGGDGAAGNTLRAHFLGPR